MNTRLEQIRTRARNAGQGGDSDQRLLYAAQAHNLAALAASDFGLCELAREMCVRQAAILLKGGPYDAATAKLALQPLINLGRLLIRDGGGETAHHHFERLFTAARSRADTVIADIPVDFSHLTATREDHRTITRWLWTILLSDGTRALTQSSCWPQVLEHAQRRNAIGRRLFDGRQAAILAHSAFGDTDQALDLLDDSPTPTPWERAVAAALRVLCLSRADRDPARAIARMCNRYLQANEPVWEYSAFRIRLGLCVIDLAMDAPETNRVTETMAQEALGAEDAFLARDLLTHHRCAARLDADTATKLHTILDAAALRTGELPPEARHELLESVQISETVLKSELARSSAEKPT